VVGVVACVPSLLADVRDYLRELIVSQRSQQLSGEPKVRSWLLQRLEVEGIALRIERTKALVEGKKTDEAAGGVGDICMMFLHTSVEFCDPADLLGDFWNDPLCK
jgi:hypothetical protein